MTSTAAARRAYDGPALFSFGFRPFFFFGAIWSALVVPLWLYSYFHGGAAALTALSAAGHPLGVCTNKPTDLSILLLDALGLSSFFSAVVGGAVLIIAFKLLGVLRRQGAVKI